MFKIDHLVINIDDKYQLDNHIIAQIQDAGYPYHPQWGKGTKGFKASNLWIGEEYFEMIRLLKAHGGGWRDDWVERYNHGHRGLISIIFETDDIDKCYSQLKEKDIDISTPEFLKFKWFFNLLTRTMPWRNAYLPFFKGIPLQIAFQQMKDQKSKDFMQKYMVPNSRDNQINGINTIVINGKLTPEDRALIKNIFNLENQNDELTILLQNNQKIIFKDSEHYTVDVFTTCENQSLLSKKIQIENINLYNQKK